MLSKPLDAIKDPDITALIEDEVREGRTLDYKWILPGGSDGDKKEFLADICSFANASGGDMLFGISEKRDSAGKQTGIPDAAVGISGFNADDEIRRLDALVRDGIAPRIPAVQIRAVGAFSGGPVLIVRVSKSWASPHMVSFKGSSRFYSRNNAGKYQLDVSELRSAFALSEALPERMGRFRDDRIAKIIADETPVPLEPNAKIVLHVLPLSSFSVASQLEPAALRAQLEHLMVTILASSHRFDIDGLLMWRSGKSDGSGTAYCQLYRTGRIEMVDAGTLKARNGEQIIPSVSYEEKLIKAVRDSLAALRRLAVPPPMLITATMIGVKGFELGVSTRLSNWDNTPIDRDLLLLPDVLVEDFDADVPKSMRPIFDAVWNAGGHERSGNFDEGGSWKPQRGG